MTYAPTDLMAVRKYLLTSTGLSGDAVGIVGDPDHAATGGYHEGNDDLARVGRLSTDYSKRESARDRPGTNAASAIDIGEFVHGAVSLRSLTLGFVDACQRGDPRTADVREVIFTPDGSTVRRFDRLGIRTTGDSSHLFHTHISFFRDSEGRRARPDNVLGLLQELIEGNDMGGYGYPDPGMPIAEAYRMDALMAGSETVRGGPYAGEPMWLVGAVKRLETAAAADATRDAAAKVAIDALAQALAAAGGSVDSAAIIARMDAIAAAESQTVASLRAEVAALRHQLAERDRAAAAAWDGTTPAG